MVMHIIIYLRHKNLQLQPISLYNCISIKMKMYPIINRQKLNYNLQ